MTKNIHIIGMVMLLSSSCHADNKNITPGETWKDTQSNAINAHGGCVQYYDGYYYWFGEDRTGTTCNGISCYKSEDLYNWERVGLALTPTGTKTDACKDIASGRTLERPKVIYNEKTGKWVMWLHWENGSDYNEAKVCVSQADQIEGPYELVDVFRPNNCDSRDQTLFLDTDGTAYHIYSTNTNTNTNISPLTEDYLAPLEDINVQMKSQKYEAACVFKVGDIYYGLFSGCTSWTPNKGRYAYAYDMMGEWTYGTDFKDSDGSHGSNFCIDSGKDNTYQSQSAYVFHVQGMDDKCFVYMGDRWNESNVGGSKYVWLPLSVRSGYPSVRWYDSWDVSVFDDMYRYKRTAEVEDNGEYYLLEKKSDRIVSRPKSSLTLEDDGEDNLCFILHKTDEPYVYKIEDSTSGKYMESVYGSIRFQEESDSEAQMWKLVLEEDGYYCIQNSSDGKCLSISGNETVSGTSVYLNDVSSSIHQSFAFYFDSQKHLEYEEADMYSASYREMNMEIMEDQNNIFSPVKSLRQDNDVQLTARLSSGSPVLELSFATAMEAQLSLVDAASGCVVWRSEDCSFQPGTRTFTLPSHLCRGVYVLWVRTPQGAVTKKLAAL